MTYYSSKTFGHDVGLSCAFRQWRADSHCHFVHGYAISVRLDFEATELDHRNWVIDFGGLKDFKEILKKTFDHKTVVAKDDPFLHWFLHGRTLGVIDLVVVERVGCEAFAELVYEMAKQWLEDQGHADRVKVVNVTIAEHGANSASYGV